MNGELVIVTLTPRGEELGRRLMERLGRGTVRPAESAARERLTEAFQAGRPLVCIMALGIVVRTLGPLAGDKATEPAVVVVDEAGRFAVSVLGGHRGGANKLTVEVAVALGATPVITTASDALGLPAVDLIGRSRGWKVENPEQLTRVAAAVVRGERIGVLQLAGSREWWREFGPWPTNFHRTDTSIQQDYDVLLLISDLELPPNQLPCAIYRPPTLVLGVGCKRGVPYPEIEAAFQEFRVQARCSPLSLGVVATVDLKADEPGLIEFAAAHGVPLRSFTRTQIAGCGELPTPSARVMAKIGVWGVAEPAALLAAETTELLVRKQRFARVTMALARREEV